MNKRKSFTLIELISIISIIAILAAIVLVNIGKYKEKAITSFVESNRASLQTAVDLYHLKNEQYPTLNKNVITVEKPQYIDLSKLVAEGYLKKDIDLSKVSEQHYWVDVFGRVWGATKPAFENASLITKKDGTQTITVEVPNEYDKLVLYKVINGQTLTADQLNLNSLFASDEVSTSLGNKVIYKQLNEWNVNGNRKIQIEIKDKDGVYLLGGVDEYKLETVPVGIGYNSEESPILRNQVGEFEYRIESLNLKEWLDFLTTEDTPSDSSITYQFAIQTTKKGDYGEWRDDFYELEDSYGLVVKITMKAGSDGSRPSLLGLRVIYNTDKEKTTSKLPSFVSPDDDSIDRSTNELKPINKDKSPINNSDIPSYCIRSDVYSTSINGEKVIYYSYYLEEGRSIFDIEGLNQMQNDSKLISVRLEVAKRGATYREVSSYTEIEEDSCISIIYTYSGDELKPNIITPIIKEVNVKDSWPIDYISPDDKHKDDLGVPDYDPSKDPSYDPNKPVSSIPKPVPSDDPQLNDSKWITLADYHLFQQGTEEITTWYDYKTSEVFEDGKTRVLYRFSTGNGVFWTREQIDFPKNKSSKALLTHVYLQIKEEYLNDPSVADPVFNWIQISSSDGYFNSDANKPQLYIYPIKDNNEGRDTISTSSKVKWYYRAADPNDFDITEVQWSTTVTSDYISYTAGKRTMRARVKNELGIWSEWASYTFNVMEEKPVAAFDIIGDKIMIPTGTSITFDTSKSYDPDGDEIVDYEWQNKKDIYNESDIGETTISLRVKDSEGYWSDWVSKKVTVYDSNSPWYVDGQPANAAGYYNMFDKNDSSSSIFKEGEITWDGDISGKTMYINVSALSRYYFSVNFYDEKGNILYYLNKIDSSGYKNNYSTSVEFTSDQQKAWLIVPEGAVKMKIVNAARVYSIEILESVIKPNVSNVNFSSTDKTITANATLSSNVSEIYLVNLDTKEVVSNSAGPVTNRLLEPDTNYNFMLVGVDSDFNGAISYHKYSTLTADVIFYGVPSQALDENDISYHTGSDYKVTWNKDISGRAMRLKLYGKGTVVFNDANGNPLHSINTLTYYSDKISTGILGFDFTAIVPSGAVEMVISNVQSFYTLDLKDAVQTNDYDSFSYRTATSTSIIFNLQKPDANSVTYGVNLTNGTVIRRTTDNSFSFSGLKAKTTYDFMIISINETTMNYSIYYATEKTT